MQKEYEVIRLVKQNAGCHIVMDYVEGQILADYLREHPKLEKEELFSWMRQMIKQLGDLQSVKGVRSYRYVTPFCMVVKRNKELMLLDLNAKSNRHILNQIGREQIWNRFFPENEPYNDIYSFGKTIQFLLAKTIPIPALTRREENKFKMIISKCLTDNSKKQYQKFSEILSDFPQTATKEKSRTIKIYPILVILILAILGGAIIYKMQKKIPVKEQSIENGLADAEEKISFLDIGLTYFLELEDYKKSKEMFERETQDKKRADQYIEMAKYMLGESEKTEEELDVLLRSLEEEAGDEPEVKHVRSILKMCVRLDTPYARKRCIETAQQILGESAWKESDADRRIETEIREILAEAYEKEGENEKALQEYETLNQWIQNEEIYRSMLRAAGEVEEDEKILEICRQGMKEHPDSAEFRVRYIQIQCRSEETTKENCEETVKEMLSECPKLLQDSEFKKLQEECGIRIEGGNVWVEK